MTADVPAARERAAACAEHVSLPFREKTWRGAAGDFAGAGVGSSMDFQDHRAYMPGDDPRHINWSAYARTGNYTMKLYREEVRPLIDVVLDVSGSMSFDEDKAQRAAELFCFCAESARREGASLRAHLVKAGNHLPLEVEAVFTDRWAEQAEAMDAGDDPRAAPEIAGMGLRPGAMRVLISDLLFPAPPEGILSSLAERDGRGLVLAPFCPAESEAGWDGNYEFVDAEDGSRQFRRVSSGLLKRYREAYGRHFELWEGLSRKHGVKMVRVGSGAALEEVMGGSFRS